MDPFTVELLTVTLRTGGDAARSLARDVERGLRLRVRRGVYVDRTQWEQLGPLDRHVIALRAAAAVAAEPPVFSHWSAAVLHVLPFLGAHLERVHTTVPLPALRGRLGAAEHLFPITATETARIHELECTSVPRTVVDLAGASPFEEGVVVADAALRTGPGDAGALLAAAVELAGPRRAHRRVDAVLTFADGRSESPDESVSRVTMHRLGLEPPELQHDVLDRRGLAGRLDFWFPRQRVGGEMDGLVKYLDPRYAAEGAGVAVYREKVREDRVRVVVAGLARWGWAEARSTLALGRVLADVGVRPVRFVLL